MEKDDELKGEGNSYDFGARMLDPRVGRWFKMDPLFQKYPYDSPYMVSGNSPISIMDPDGERKRKVTHEITLDKDGKTVQSIQTEDKIMNYELKSVKRITGYDYFSGDAIITYDYYDTVDIEIIVKNADGEILTKQIFKDNILEKRFTDKTFTPKFILETNDKISEIGFGGYSFSDGGGSSNKEYIRKGDRNTKWLDGKGLGSVLLTLLGKDLKAPGGSNNNTKGGFGNADNKIDDFITAVDNAVEASKEVSKVNITISDSRLSSPLGENGSAKAATRFDDNVRDTLVNQKDASKVRSKDSKAKQRIDAQADAINTKNKKS